MTAKTDLSGGVWPVMVTPFQRDRSIDWNGLDRLVEWYVEAGVAGLFAVCLSSEMFDLDEEERFAIAARIVRRVNGRLPVVASGTFGGEWVKQAESVRRMADQGVAAVVVLASAMARERDDESAWMAYTEYLLRETGDIPLGLYECPEPYHRLLSPGALAWAVSTGRFLFLKETSGQLPSVKAKLGSVRGTALRLYNASAADLLESIRLGADGFCGTSANFVPELWVWLCKHAQDEPETADRLQAFLRKCEPVFSQGYPASAKQFMTIRGLKLGPTCRSHSSDPAEPDSGRLADILRQAETWRGELGI